MPNFETRLKDVSHAAWLIWTANGLGLDDLGLEQTSKSATDAANNAYVEGISALGLHTPRHQERRQHEQRHGNPSGTRDCGKNRNSQGASSVARREPCGLLTPAGKHQV